VNSVKLSDEQIGRAFSMLKNARNILESEGYFYAKEINRFLETIPSQAAHAASYPGEGRGRCNEQVVTKE
jgi:hypothetical protein